MTPKIGGSDVAAILGFSPWATPFDAWDSIMHGRSSAGNAATDRGNRLEGAILDWYADTQRPIRNRQVEVEGPAPWMSGHLDAVTLTRIVEAKTDARGTWAPHGTVIERWPDGDAPIPPYYASQAYWYLEITSFEAVDFAVLTGRLEFRVVTLARDPAIQGRIRALVERWHAAHVATGEPPPLDWSDTARRAATTMPVGKALRLATPEEAATVREYARLGAEIKKLEQTRKALGTELLARLGPDYGMDLGDGAKLIAPGTKGRTTYDLKRLEKDYPGFLNNYARQGEPTRQVRTYGLGEDDE